MVLLELFRVNDAEVAADAHAVRIQCIRALELLVFFLCEVRHRALELGNDHAGHERARREDTELRFPRGVRVAACMRNLNGARGQVELKIARGVAGLDVSAGQRE